MNIRLRLPRLVISLAALLYMGPGMASELSVPNAFTAGTPAVAAEVNENFDAAASAVNDNHDRLQTLEALHGDVTVIENISWDHNQPLPYFAFYNTGLAFWFSRPVSTSALLVDAADNLTVELLQLQSDGSWERFTTGVNLYALSAVDLSAGSITDVTVDFSDPALAQGFLLLPPNLPPSGTYRVVIRTGFLADENGRAVDGDFLLGQTPTGDGLPGGTFESWFTVPAP